MPAASIGWRSGATLLAALALLPALAGFVAAGQAQTRHRDVSWSASERATLASMSLERLPPSPLDPSNSVSGRAEAAALGREFFNDARLSRNGRVSCASCHDPARQFQDDRPLGRGLAEGSRRTMPLAGLAGGAWFFWDGRKDSLWSQALGPLEDGLEHGSNRTRIALLVRQHYRHAYEKVFGPLPSLAGVAEDAGPLGSASERLAWQGMSEAQRRAVNRVFSNLGKAIAAYERTLALAPSRFDQYLRAVEADDAAGRQVLTADEVQGLRLFIGKAQCASCHNGPLLSDQHFHNTGVAALNPAKPDRGRAAGVARVQADEFNCLGRYSDAPAQACAELRFIAADDPGMEGAFKTPGLRNVALRPPYMHAGQLASLDEVLAHYRRAPPAATGTSELASGTGPRQGKQQIRLSEDEARQVVAFLRTLSAPVDARKE